ncbi:integrase domain-containing protein [Paenibacillus alvei]|uniref:phage integrase N-terminal domain-containing protein n=1 Tax=Paenibacillus alvei TaxID=44250 RepID=UPI002280CAE5|nr:phage integrase N-terminal domain-containing protein [Paenibacillus alvei]MCY9732156.1 integrase domain-containing protein [Paenibacillus alvei]MCY9758322.1 integrase domain-containing protein [Paenibacillus alvei]
MGKSTIEVQVEKIFKHTRQGSYATRDRYKDSCLMFVRFCMEKFKMQNVRNLHDKHLAEFIKHRLNSGIDPKTVKGDLSALRYMHDQVQKPRYVLSNNEQLQEKYAITIGTTSQVNGDRSWTTAEYEGMLRIARELGNSNVADCLTLARTMGMRVTEAAAVSRSQAEYALRTGNYQIKGEAKNGKHREVRLSTEGRIIFERRLVLTNRGDRLFIQPGEKTHQVVNRMEKFVQHHRDKVVTGEGVDQRTDKRDGSSRNLTFHGLRYNYVQDRMHQELEKGYSRDNAALIVSREVGHERIDVIKIYEG